jgi:hypothetical protein
MIDLERTVAKLQAAEDIRSLKARYADACDTGYLPERMRPLFTDDAVWDGGRFGRYEGIEAVCGFFGSVSADIIWALHYMIAPSIEVGDTLDQARGTWYLWQPCTVTAEGGPKAVWLTGRYADRYRRGPSGWQFSEVLLDVQSVTPYEDGWVRKPFWDA